jgi:hypothetical protein
LNPILNNCPVCGNSLSITRLHCRSCDTTIEGRFQGGRLSQLGPEQMQFVETFLQCEGKIKAVEAKLGISYPTVRARLRDIITAMGYEPSDEPPEEIDPVLAEQERRRVLDDLAAGRISSEEAIAVLRGETLSVHGLPDKER